MVAFALSQLHQFRRIGQLALDGARCARSHVRGADARASPPAPPWDCPTATDPRPSRSARASRLFARSQSRNRRRSAVAAWIWSIWACASARMFELIHSSFPRKRESASCHLLREESGTPLAATACDSEAVLRWQGGRWRRLRPSGSCRHRRTWPDAAPPAAEPLLLLLLVVRIASRRGIASPRLGLRLEGFPDDRRIRYLLGREDAKDGFAARPVNSNPADARRRNERHLRLVLKRG